MVLTDDICKIFLLKRDFRKIGFSLILRTKSCIEICLALCELSISLETSILYCASDWTFEIKILENKNTC